MASISAISVKVTPPKPIQNKASAAPAGNGNAIKVVASVGGGGRGNISFKA